jgi:hypothetical protein
MKRSRTQNETNKVSQNSIAETHEETVKVNGTAGLASACEIFLAGTEILEKIEKRGFPHGKGTDFAYQLRTLRKLLPSWRKNAYGMSFDSKRN